MPLLHHLHRLLRRCPPQPLLVLVLLLLLQLSHSTRAACRFPTGLQTNVTAAGRRTSAADDDAATPPQRDWVGRVRDQFTEIGVRVAVEGNVMRTTSTDRDVRTNSRVCLQIVSGDRYLVAHEQQGQNGNRYTCLQFIERAPDVYQIRSAPISDKMDRALCRDANLQTDRWLLVDRARIGRGRVTCPLVGGFSIHIFDKSRNEGVCDAYRGQTRLESECQRGDGVSFLYRTTRCVPSDLYMHSRQPTACVAGWSDGRHRFTVLRHDEAQHPYYWLLRTPSDQLPDPSAATAGGTTPNPSTAFTAILFKDLVADITGIVNETRNYIRLDVMRDPPRPVSSLCADEYEMCTDPSADVSRRCSTVGSQSWNELALTCPLTCGLCRPGGGGQPRPSAMCQLPTAWSRLWMDGASGDPIGVNATSFQMPGGTSMHCVRWKSAEEELEEEDEKREREGVMLVSDFTDGCRPRYRCARVVRRSSSLLYMQLSEAMNWPLVRAPRDPVDCRAFNFDRWTSSSSSGSDGGGSGTKGYFLPLIDPPLSTTDVVCDLPPNLSNYVVSFPGVNTSGSSSGDCSASLTDTGHSALSLSLSGCSGEQRRRLAAAGVSTGTAYSCLQSSKSSNGELVIVTHRPGGETSSRLVCWLFVRQQQQQTPTSAFYLLVGEQCHSAVATRAASIRPDQLPHTASFSRPRRTSPPVVVVPPTTSTAAASTANPRTPQNIHPARTSASSTTAVRSSAAAASKPSRTASTTPTPTYDDTDFFKDTPEGPPRTQNSTMTDMEQNENNVAVNAFVVFVVAVFLAIVQAIIFCRY